MEDKSYWKQYSAVGVGEYMLYINSGNEDWALFKSDSVSPRREDDLIGVETGLVFVADKQDLVSYTGKEVQHSMGMMETMLSAGVHWEVVSQLVAEYLDFLNGED